MKTRQQGTTLIGLLLFTISICFVVYSFVIVPMANEQLVNEMRNKFPPVTSKEMRLIDEYQRKPKPVTPLLGEYFGLGEVDGKKFKVRYTFREDRTIIKSAEILGKYELTGMAKFEFNGSTIVFTDVKGDKLLFSEIGEAITVKSPDSIVAYGSETSVVLKTGALQAKEAAEVKKMQDEEREALQKASWVGLESDQLVSKIMDLPWFRKGFFLFFVLGVCSLILSIHRRRMY